MHSGPMPTDTQRRAAEHLFAARRANRAGDRIDPSCRPATVEEGLAVQRALTAMLEAQLNERIAGWKCSAPTEERSVSAAPVFASGIQHSSPCRLLPRAGLAPVEPEIAFVLGRDLPPRASPYTEAEVRAAIAETRLVLELIASRYADPAAVSFPEFLADHVSNQGLLVGPLVSTGAGEVPAHITLDVLAPGLAREREGRHPDGNPLLPLYWLANFLNASGDALKAGQIVTTGSYAGVIEVPLGTPVHIRFGELGVIDAVFEAAR